MQGREESSLVDSVGADFMLVLPLSLSLSLSLVSELGPSSPHLHHPPPFLSSVLTLLSLGGLRGMAETCLGSPP